MQPEVESRWERAMEEADKARRVRPRGWPREGSALIPVGAMGGHRGHLRGLACLIYLSVFKLMLLAGWKTGGSMLSVSVSLSLFCK